MAKKFLSGLGVITIALLGMRYTAGQTVSKPADTVTLHLIASNLRFGNFGFEIRRTPCQ